MIGVGLMELGMTASTAMKLIFSASLIGGGVGMMKLLSLWFRPKAAWVGALLYITAPYQIFDIFWRGSVGETLSFGLFPLVMWMTILIAKKKLSYLWGGVGLGLFLLAHNLMVALSLAIIGWYGGWFFNTKEKKRLIKPMVMGFLIACFFWIPALAEMDNTVMSESSLNRTSVNDFLGLKELMGLHKQTDKPPLSQMKQLGFAQMAVVGLAIWQLIKRGKDNKLGWIFLAVFGGGALMTLEISRGLWEEIPMMRYFQHPLRFLFVTVVASSILGAYVINKKSSWWIGVLIGLVWINYVAWYSAPEYFVPYDDGFLRNYPLTSAAADEFDPPWFDQTKATAISELGEGPVWADKGEVEMIESNGSYKEYIVRTDEKTQIIEKTLYFPGWRVWVNGQEIDIDENKNEYGGLINFKVEKGDWKIESKFTQNTPARMIGNGLSLLGLGWLMFEMGIKARDRIRNNWIDTQ